MEKLAQEAISLALSGKWEEALTANLKILKKEPQNLDALNRAARASHELGQTKSAIKFAQKVLQIDTYETSSAHKIAQKALEKWKGAASSQKQPATSLSSRLFLEEPGKTKIVSLINLGATKLILNLTPGDEIKMIARGKSICVLTQTDKYIGRVPDDLSARLIELMKHGNTYQVLVKTVGKNEVKVFLRELKKAESLKNVPSFSAEKVHYIAFTPPELVHAKENPPNMPETDEEEV
jgi:tetratricopeptide (TPR) repeat protein